MGKVAIDNTPSLNPTGTLSITENGNYNVASYANASVQVSGVELVDINPNKLQTNDYILNVYNNNTSYTALPVCGYTKLYLSRGSYGDETTTYTLVHKDGTVSSPITMTIGSDWVEIDISDSMIVKLSFVGSGTTGIYYYSLLT